MFAHLACVSLLLAAAALSSPPPPSASELQKAVNAAIAEGLPIVRIRGGKYEFGNLSFQIEHAKSLRLVAAEPVELWFSGNAGVNITGAEDLFLGNWTIDYTDIDNAGNAGFDYPLEVGITFNLLDCTRVTVEDLTIRNAPFMAVTAWNGGGDHVFRRLRFEPVITSEDCPWAEGPPEVCHLVAKRDAIHFSDQRVGPTFEDSVIGYSGDDLFNIHTTVMIVLRCDSHTSCLVVNPHLSPVKPINSVYGTNSVLGMVAQGDAMSFFSWPTDKFETQRYGAAPLSVEHTERITDKSLLSEAATLVPQLQGDSSVNPVTLTNQTAVWDASELWRIHFAGPVPEGVGRTAMVQIDTISNTGTKLLNNTFTNTSCNLGRYKSPNSIIAGNIFRNGRIPNLELTFLPQFFEGPVIISNITIRDNIFNGEGANPLHCGPWCESTTCVGQWPQSLPWTEEGCNQCPDCMQVDGETQWTTGIHLINNTVIPGDRGLDVFLLI